jgi:hypothetical protein
MTTTMTRINVLVPPMLEAALGYQGAARWVAFYWEPSGDELRYEDGSLSADVSWLAWLTFVRHPRLAPHLQQFHFGNSEEPAQQWLLLDRETRTLSVGAPAMIKQFLREATPPHLTSAALTALQDSIRQRLSAPQHIPVLVAQAMQREQRLVQELRTWLDAHEH